MNELTFEDLVPYLPYKLNIIFEGQNTEHRLIGLDVSNAGVLFTSPLEKVGRAWYEDSKPILRPLSDLLNEIEHNGERFVPAHKLKDETIKMGLYKTKFAKGYDDYVYRIIKKPFGEILKVQNHDDWVLIVSLSDMGRNKKYVMDLLHSWHFDTNNLIERGLAIDINFLSR